VNPTVRLGRIAGIRIGVNWSWLIVFALIVWSLEASVFPAQNPGHSDGTYLAMAIVAALLFFGSLLLHELGHALQARREHVEIDISDLARTLGAGGPTVRPAAPGAA
jgi:Zn-dependent protease